METTRFENSNHGLKVGETVKVFEGGKWHYGRITGFEQFEGSGLCFVDGLVRLSCFNYPIAHGAVTKMEPTAGVDSIKLVIPAKKYRGERER